jgi:AcrR family transcriptional regulator
MTEQQRSPKSRPYRMSKRADDVAQTRARIVEAAVRLHGTIGPAATTVSALAEEAQVTRLTIYRHFPDPDALFDACSRHWASGQVMPDPASWADIDDPEQRLLVGLADLYRFYAEAEPMLTLVARDHDVVPVGLRQRSAATNERYVDTLVEPFAPRGARRERLRAVVGHVVAFPTWRSLCREQGLRHPTVVRCLADLVLATASRTSGWS